MHYLTWHFNCDFSWGGQKFCYVFNFFSGSISPSPGWLLIFLILFIFFFSSKNWSWTADSGASTSWKAGAWMNNTMLNLYAAEEWRFINTRQAINQLRAAPGPSASSLHNDKWQVCGLTLRTNHPTSASCPWCWRWHMNIISPQWLISLKMHPNQ